MTTSAAAPTEQRDRSLQPSRGPLLPEVFKVAVVCDLIWAHTRAPGDGSRSSGAVTTPGALCGRGATSVGGLEVVHTRRTPSTGTSADTHATKLRSR